VAGVFPFVVGYDYETGGSVPLTETQRRRLAG
jgi:hypothetical protein